MKDKLKIIVCLFFITHNFSQAQLTVEWLNSNGSNDSVYGHSVSVDSNDNVFVAGHFRGDISFDSNSNNFDYTAGQYGDVYLQKFDDNGDFIWAKVFQSNDSTERPIITIDQNDNIYIISTFIDDIDLDPGINEDIHVSTGWGENTYIVKLDNNGDYLWGKTFENVSDNQIIEAYEITVDNNGDILLAGIFQSTVDFDPSSNTSIIVGSGRDSFILKIDSNGNFIWVKHFTGSRLLFSTITTDSQNNIIAGGALKGGSSVDVDPGSGVFNLFPPTNPNNCNLFILKLNESGEFIWAKKAEGFSNNTDLHSGTDRVHSIVIDDNDDIVFAGAFRNNINFDTNSTSFILDSGINGSSNQVGNRTGYLAKMNSNGAMIWAKMMEGNYAQSSGNHRFYESNIVLDFNENHDLFFGYGFRGNLIYDIDGIPYSYSSNRNGWDISLFQINPVNGDFISAHYIPPINSSTTFVYNNFIGKIIFKGNSLFACGTLSEQLFFDSNSSIDPNGTNAFVVKYDNVTSLSLDQQSLSKVSVYPNPTTTEIHIKTDLPIVKISVYSIQGQKVLDSSQTVINVENLSNGLYFLEIEGINNTKVVKQFIKQ